MIHAIAARKMLDTQGSCERWLGEALQDSTGLLERYLFLQLPNDESALSVLRLCHHSTINAYYAIEKSGFLTTPCAHHGVDTLATQDT